MQNQPIQLSNDVTVTLFLNQSSENFEPSLEMIISTSVQNFSRTMLHIAMATHSLKGIFDKLDPQNQWWRHCDVISQSISTKFCIFVCYTKRHLWAKFEQNRTRNKEVAKKGNDVIVTSFLKIAQQFCVCEYFYSYLLMYQVSSWLKVR